MNQVLRVAQKPAISSDSAVASMAPSGKNFGRGTPMQFFADLKAETRGIVKQNRLKAVDSPCSELNHV